MGKKIRVFVLLWPQRWKLLEIGEKEQLFDPTVNCHLVLVIIKVERLDNNSKWNEKSGRVSRLASLSLTIDSLTLYKVSPTNDNTRNTEF